MKLLLVLFISILALAGCTQKAPEIHSIQGEVFGSYYIVKYRGDLKREHIKKELSEFFKDFSSSFSVYEQDSVVNVFNESKANQRMIVSWEFIELLKIVRILHQQTDGAFDPTIRPVLKMWQDEGMQGKMPKGPELRAALEKVNFNFVHWDEKEVSVWKTKEGIQLDLSAIAPGYAADLVAKIFDKYKIENYMVDISGEVFAKGDPGMGQKWILGLERPSKDKGKLDQITVIIKDQAVASSGKFQEFYDASGSKQGLAIDPRTGHKVDQSIASATAIAPTAALADGWAMAMRVLGDKGIALAQKHGIKVSILKARTKNNFEETATNDFKDQIVK